MTGLKRIYTFVTGFLMIAFGILLLIFPDTTLYFILGLLLISMVLSGIRQIVYYFTMAKHMIGGKFILYRGIFICDAGLMILLLIDDPKVYVIFYLIAGLAISGTVSVLRGIEKRKLKVASWEIGVISGAIKLAIAATSLFFIQSETVPVYIFAVGLLYSACVRIAESLRKSAIIYVQ